MSDVRQGVTPAGHAVLDMVDLLRGPDGADPLRLIDGAVDQIHVAGRRGDLESRRSALIQAAAFSILAAELIEELAR